MMRIKVPVHENNLMAILDYNIVIVDFSEMMKKYSLYKCFARLTLFLRLIDKRR